MGTIATTVSTTAQGQVFTRTYNVPDGDLNRIIAAYQSAANTAINGTATPNQVFAYVTQQWINKMSADAVAFQHQGDVAAVPPPPPMSIT